MRILRGLPLTACLLCDGTASCGRGLNSVPVEPALPRFDKAGDVSLNHGHQVERPLCSWCWNRLPPRPPPPPPPRFLKYLSHRFLRWLVHFYAEKRSGLLQVLWSSRYHIFWDFTKQKNLENKTKASLHQAQIS